MKKIGWFFLVIGMLLPSYQAAYPVEIPMANPRRVYGNLAQPDNGKTFIEEILWIQDLRLVGTATMNPGQADPTTTATPRELSLQPTPLSGGDVAAVQSRLSDLGYGEVGNPDGVFDRQTELAVRHFQLLNRLPISGYLTAEENELLFSKYGLPYNPAPAFPGTLRKNTWLGYDRMLFERLETLGYMNTDQSEWTRAYFGEETEKAVMRFQKDNKLVPTGIVDYGTWKSLFSVFTAPVGGTALLRLDDANDWQSDIIQVGQGVIAMEYAGDKLWLLLSTGTGYDQNTLLPLTADAEVIDTLAPILVGQVNIPDNPVSGIVKAGNLLWLLFPNGKAYGAVPDIAVYHPGSGDLVKRFSFGECPDGFCFPSSALGYDGKLVWASAGDRVWGMDVPSGRVIRSYPVGWLASGSMVSDGSCLWMRAEAGMTAFHPGGGICPFASQGYQIYGDVFVSDGKWLWYTCAGCDAIQAVDPKRGLFYEPIQTGGSITAMTFDGKWIWLADGFVNTVKAFNPKTGAFGDEVPVIANPSHLLHDGKLLWIYSANSGVVQHLDVSVFGMAQITVTPMLATATPTPRPSPTMPALERSLSLKTPGMNGQDVLWLQERLQELGYTEVGIPDGFFGPKTDQGVRHFQERNGLVVDGVVGPVTMGQPVRCRGKSAIEVVGYQAKRNYGNGVIHTSIVQLFFR